jgi:hypothetical protein
VRPPVPGVSFYFVWFHHSVDGVLLCAGSGNSRTDCALDPDLAFLGTSIFWVGWVLSLLTVSEVASLEFKLSEL